MHWDARQTAYLAAGDQAQVENLRYDSTLTSGLFVTDVLLEAPSAIRTVAVLGDSITDGNGASLDAFKRWPDFLAERLAADGIAVLNAGISGARLLTDGMGDSALARFERDVLGKPHIDTAVVLLGINDIAWPGSAFEPDAPAPALELLIAGYQQLITQAHLRHVRIVGGMLLPFEGALEGSPITRYHSPEKERLRQQVNEWIRTSGSFDAVLDFDAWLRDPAHPTRLLGRYDSGDRLHPGDTGNQAMAERIDLHVLLGKPQRDMR
jgi:lysophospholipase L1-like esterase